MARYEAVSGLWGRKLFEVDAGDTLTLRKEVRSRIGWRKSARMRYRRIGAHSFRVESPFGRIVMDVFKL